MVLGNRGQVEPRRSFEVWSGLMLFGCFWGENEGKMGKRNLDVFGPPWVFNDVQEMEMISFWIPIFGPLWDCVSGKKKTTNAVFQTKSSW